MPTVSLALMWHQHQPYYPDDVAGENPMPWVRLHGTKDYLGMALHLEEVPEFRCTINLVPSLLVQIEAYVQGATDQHLRVSRLPADGMDHDDALYLLDNFFMAHADAMIRPHPRYHELYHQRGLGVDSAEQALPRFRERDIRDLQVWSNLSWMHPILFEKDAELAEFKAKGRRYTEDEKQWLLDKQRELLAQIIPLHRKLADRGQVELTTTPFYHPIVPLLFDKRLAREAMPDVNLPGYRDGYLDDAEVHVKRAVESHQKHFGERPRGMWPSEGSVCQAMIPLLARHGIEWIATDEEILGASTQGKVGRDSRGHVRHPELLYRAWKVAEQGSELGIVFRDHSMSDQVGFHYQRSPGPAAASDFLGKLHAIGDACRQNPATLVPVILDGENCWEYYPDGGVSFLRSLYQSAARDSRVRPVTVGEFLRDYPPADTLPRLFSGSWISHNFAIWIGHPEDNRAWDALHATRQFLVSEVETGRHTPEILARAWDEIYIAEGSDWFWWYGDDHSSALDALFDHLFRKHLRNVYSLLSQDPPGTLFTPISQAVSHRPIHDQPTSFLNVKVDGRSSYFEWINAARYLCGNERGTMALVTRGPLHSIWFGFSADRLLIRVDTDGGPASERLAETSQLRVGFVDPAEWEIVVENPSLPRPTAHINHAGQPSSNGTTVEVATGKILELAVPFGRLGLRADDPIRFYVELIEGESSVDRAPREGIFELAVPTPDFERILWQV
ncbi:glycoside hydrolase family 57 protein [Singulisphaera acidiphila]|uniref:Alpha-amylase/alpha-mannosidase n=1 Tax=Singulisphaera acidiphila (strain ATCC BAA-1392 / DSM 18658 / VKM B-2454 / MOB10) TaxID=886293 RepID=L0DMM8_SINAD|nr:glycoside hydrolase family 57 protein [Singulisphaera acidiphila]AGA30639.1 alpha-amylase/alpha-mannosidase [Singulisphaera acidiphila DSM 18658]